VKLRREVTDAIKKINNDDDVIVAIIKGAGKAFSAGHDLTEVYFRYGAGVGKPGERRPSQRVRLHGDDEILGEYLKTVMYCWKVTIAQIHGNALPGQIISIRCAISVLRLKMLSLLLRNRGWLLEGRRPCSFRR